MQWTKDGGFSGVRPWLPYGDLAINANDQAKDPNSLLSLYRRLIWYRRSSDALRFGDYAPLDAVPESVFAYTRTAGADRTLTVLNFTSSDVAFELPDGVVPRETLFGTHGHASPEPAVKLRGNEGRLYTF